MPPSYRRINYALRPAKNVERKLIADTLVRLNRITPVKDMRYIGLGSVYFADFSMFHRRLGFNEMHSIEESTDLDIRKRFEFNRPFDTKLHFSHTNSALPQIAWDRPSVVWLDYDDQFDAFMLSDINTIVTLASFPCVLIISVNVEPGGPDGRRARLLEHAGDLLPRAVKSDADLGGAKLGNAIKSILVQGIQLALADRNGVRSSDPVQYEQIFHFRYADGAKMLTIGGLLFPASEQDEIANCDFHALPHVRRGDDSFDITVPKLTVRETLNLDSQLPTDGSIQTPGVSRTELDLYAQLYRYLPSYVDIEL
jgi:hypothetical protein